MDKDDLIILIIALLLLAGMLITAFFGGEKSLHGVGFFENDKKMLAPISVRSASRCRDDSPCQS
jgi:hypothetical protein